MSSRKKEKMRIRIRKKLEDMRTIRWLLSDRPEEEFSGLAPSEELIAKLARFSNKGVENKKEKDFVSYQLQINPHFLYNTLDSIRSEALLCKNTNIAMMTEKLACFFRYSISARRDILTIKDELQSINDYFYIQQYRFGNRFRLEIKYDDNSILNAEIPKMTLQPIVENAIFHGVERRAGNGVVTVRLFKTGEFITIVISDNGGGMSQEVLTELNARLNSFEQRSDRSDTTHGIALPNVNMRLKMHFGDSYGIEVHSVEGIGTDVEIRIPYIIK